MHDSEFQKLRDGLIEENEKLQTDAVIAPAFGAPLAANLASDGAFHCGPGDQLASGQYTGDQLLSDVWGYNSYSFTRTVDSHILTLRQKLEVDLANPAHFLTVHNVGYKFVP